MKPQIYLQRDMFFLHELSKWERLHDKQGQKSTIEDCKYAR